MEAVDLVPVSTMGKRVLGIILAGLALALVSSLFPYEFCADGNGRGLPFAIHHPHRGALGNIETFSKGECTYYLDLSAAAKDVVILGMLAWLGWRLVRKMLRRQS